MKFKIFDKIDIKNIHKMRIKDIPLYFTLIFCMITAFIGSVFISTNQYIGVYRVLFIVIGVCFLVLSFRLFKEDVKKEVIGRFLIFAVSAILIGLIIDQFPSVFSLERFSIDAAFSRSFLLSFGLFFYGLIGVILSIGVIYNFSVYAKQYSAYVFLLVALVLVIYPLILIVGHIVRLGAPAISWEFLTKDISDLGAEGGIYPAIIGTLLLMLITGVVAIPLGVGSAIFLREYVKEGISVRVIKTAVNILRGTPSIVFGLFGFAVFVPIFGVSVLTGGLILGFYALPMVIRASEEALKSVPQELREGSYALGATKWQTIRRVVLPPAMPGVITGSILGVGEASGEVAPILFTAVAFMGAGVPNSLLAPIQALPYHLYELTNLMGYKSVEANAWGTAFVLLAIVLIMNAVAIVIRERFREEF